MEMTERKTSELNINQEKLFNLKAERQRWKLKLTEPQGCARQYQMSPMCAIGVMEERKVRMGREKYLDQQ